MHSELLIPPLSGAHSLGEHSSLPIGASHSWLAPIYFITYSSPPLLALLHQMECFSITISAPQPRVDSLLFLFTLLQHLLSTPLFHTALPIWCSAFSLSTPHLACCFFTKYSTPGAPVFLLVAPLFHLNISYCLSNPHWDVQLANMSLHLCLISQIERNDFGIQFKPPARYEYSENPRSTSSFCAHLMNCVFLLSSALLRLEK